MCVCGGGGRWVCVCDCGDAWCELGLYASGIGGWGVCVCMYVGGWVVGGCAWVGWWCACARLGDVRMCARLYMAEGNT